MSHVSFKNLYNPQFFSYDVSILNADSGSESLAANSTAVFTIQGRANGPLDTHMSYMRSSYTAVDDSYAGVTDATDGVIQPCPAMSQFKSFRAEINETTIEVMRNAKEIMAKYMFDFAFSSAAERTESIRQGLVCPLSACDTTDSYEWGTLSQKLIYNSRKVVYYTPLSKLSNCLEVARFVPFNSLRLTFERGAATDGFMGVENMTTMSSGIADTYRLRCTLYHLNFSEQIMASEKASYEAWKNNSKPVRFLYSRLKLDTLTASSDSLNQQINRTDLLNAFVCHYTVGADASAFPLTQLYGTDSATYYWHFQPRFHKLTAVTATRNQMNVPISNRDLYSGSTDFEMTSYDWNEMWNQYLNLFKRKYRGDSLAEPMLTYNTMPYIGLIPIVISPSLAGEFLQTEDKLNITYTFTTGSRTNAYVAVLSEIGCSCVVNTQSGLWTVSANSSV